MNEITMKVRSILYANRINEYTKFGIAMQKVASKTFKY